MRRGIRLPIPLIALIGIAALVPVRSASAHPSDAETLTLDLLLGPQGLEAVDAAVVLAPGPSDEQLPSEEDRRAVAANVLDALGVSSVNASIDASTSERYHEVGFTIRLREPFATATEDRALQVVTTRLQQIAEAANVKRLKLEVCDATAPEPHAGGSADAVPPVPPLELQVDTTTPGRASDASQNERAGCEVWTLAIDGSPVSLSARVVPRTLAGTGNNRDILVVGIGVLVLGLGLVELTRRRGNLSIELAPESVSYAPAPRY